MSSLSRELARYLTVRRGLGYDLATPERILRRFVAFAEREGADHISTALFQRWRETSAAPAGKLGRPAWSRSGSLPNGCTASMQGMKCRQRS